MRFEAKKSLGQNFLIDNNICQKIVSALEIASGDNVIEVGPGRGALTRYISSSGGRVTALEKDMSLCFFLREQFPDVDVVCVDALAFDWTRSGRLQRLRITGNLPYNIASRILWDIASRTDGFQKAVFMVQKEVGRRIVALPGSKQYGALSVWMQSFLKPELLFQVPPGVFRPRPKVDSVVLSFQTIAHKKNIFSSRKLARTLKLMFQKRRKQLGNILRTYWNDELNCFFKNQDIDIRSRPEDLSPHDFQRLAEKIF